MKSWKITKKLRLVLGLLSAFAAHGCKHTHEHHEEEKGKFVVTKKAEAEFASIEYQNTKVQADGKVVSPNELALAKAKMSKAQAEMALAKVHRDLTEINAPSNA